MTTGSILCYEDDDDDSFLRAVQPDLDLQTIVVVCGVLMGDWLLDKLHC